MRVGVVREIKPAERRVGLTPTTAGELVARGHTVLVETGAGVGAGYSDEAYRALGAELVAASEDVWGESELLVKVKEPLAREFDLLHPDLTLFSYLHLASAPELTDALVASGSLGLAYETVNGPAGDLPLLAPMSEIAGRLATQVGAYFLQATQGGPGLLIGGVPGVAAARVVVVGGGVVGTQAARVAVGMGAEVTILERSPARLRALDDQFGGRVRTTFSDPASLAAEVTEADLVIGAVLVPGARAPRLLSRGLLGQLQPDSVLVDVAIDQGGCAETSRPTTHGAPVYSEEGVLHYCVTNMPGAVPTTATRALTNATAPYVLAIADAGIEAALSADEGLSAGVNVRAGEIVLPELRRDTAVLARTA